MLEVSDHGISWRRSELHPHGPRPSRCHHPPPAHHAGSVGQQLLGGRLVRRKRFNRELQGRVRGLASCLPARGAFRSFRLTKGGCRGGSISA